MVQSFTVSWSTIPIDQLFTSLQSSKDGLSQEEADRRLKISGPNILATQKKVSLLGRFISKLTNPLILLLLFAAIISAVLGQLSDFLIIIIIMLVSITIDVVQEHTAVEGAEKLKKRVSLTATVIRDGIAKDIPLAAIVPGDVITLSVGDIVPGDARLLRAIDFSIDESTLTGESFPQAKSTGNSVYMGTNVIAGEGTAIVVHTGSNTEYGHIASDLVAKRPETEFEKGINDFGFLLAKTALIVAAGVFISHIFLGHNFFSSLLFVLALAIGFAPELLPIIITINLSKGAIRMSRHGVIVKSLPSIEDFGSMDILCTDKTGTLTENAITLERYENLDSEVSPNVLELGYITSLFQTGFSGPMEKAILDKAKGTKVSYDKVTGIPFDFYRKRLSVVVKREKEYVLIVKGAPEEILAISTSYEVQGKVARFSAAKKAQATKHFEDLSREGLRALGVGYKKVSGAKKTFTAGDETDLTYVGLLAFDDPAKQTVSASLRLLKDRGVDVKILTGDNELVTQKICRDIGLTVKGIRTGRDLESVSQRDLQKVVEQTTIFARINPTLKENIITALRSNGHVVGYLGDGINDAPSLKAADIGISVNNAVDVAKETADIILLHKDLHVLSQGVHEGRVTYGNVLKYLKMGMSSNFGNMVSIAAASIFLPFLPLLPVQVLLNDMLYDVSQLLLASDYVDSAYLKKPHPWNIGEIKKFMLVFGPISSLFDFATFFLLLTFFRASAALFQTGWFLESIITQVLIIFSIRTHIVPFFKSRIHPFFAASLLTISAIVLLLPVSPVGNLFSFVPLPFLFYPALGIVIISYFFLVEFVKLWFYAKFEL